MSVIDNLVTDRTQADVDTIKALLKKPVWEWEPVTDYNYFMNQAKGVYKHTDLNRVENAVDYIAAALVQAPVDLAQYAADRGVAWSSIFDVPYDPTDFENITTKTDWKRSDFPSVSQMTRYLNNVALIKTAFPVSVPLPASMNNITFSDANNIEQVLLQVYEALQICIDTIQGYIRSAMEVSYSGEIYSGEREA